LANPTSEKSLKSFSQSNYFSTMGSIASDIDTFQILGKLTLDEKISLLAAKDWWRTEIVDRDGVFVPQIKVGGSCEAA
jgi:hypothetical protein